MEFLKTDNLIMSNIAYEVKVYFDSALRPLEITNELILQWFNSPDPVKE